MSCGQLLRHAREQRGLTLQDIAQATKIPAWHLNAIERDNFAALPSGMYRRAEVRAYADVVGLDRRLAVACLDRALERLTPSSARTTSAPPPAPVLAGERRRVLMAAGAAVTAAVTALALWASQSGTTGIASLPPPSPAPSAAFEPPPQQQLVRPPVTAAVPTLESALAVVTEPLGARVTVDGVGWGVTPVTVPYVSPGTRRVRVTKEGYRAEERRIQIEPGGATTTLHIPLRTEEPVPSRNQP
jgi:hypothetical protein